MQLLVTNDDGIASPGIFALKKALEKIGDVAVIAPHKNRSAAGRAITIGQSLEVDEFLFSDGGTGYSVNGTPVDCVRLASLGFIERQPDMIISGINMGVNLGDDITYSGTVAAAFEGIILGIPSIAVSVERNADDIYHFQKVAAFTARLAEKIAASHLPGDIMLNINSPNLPEENICGVEVTRLGKRIYRDQLVEEVCDEGSTCRKRYHIYGDDPSYHKEDGTDFHAISEGKISVTPLHFALTNVAGMETIGKWDLDSLLRPGRVG